MTLKLYPRERETIGILTKEECPLCKEKNLLENKLGQKWCSSMYCRYGFKELRDYYWPKNKHRKDEEDDSFLD